MKNKYNVQAGQVWKDNDERLAKREFEIVYVDLDYYPGGRARCKLLGRLEKGQRQIFHARLDRFNGTKRGYSLVRDVSKPKANKAKAKPAKKKR